MTLDSESLVSIKPGNLGAVIGYQVDEFTCTSLVKHFAAQSHIYPVFTGRVSILTTSCLNHDVMIIVFGSGSHILWIWFDSILNDSVETMKLDASIDKSDTMTSSVSSLLLHSTGTISDNSKLKFAPSMTYLKLWCQARILVLPLSLVGKI